MYLYHVIEFKQPGNLFGAKLYIDSKFISNGKIRKGTKIKGVLVMPKEPTLSHYGIKGQKWGVRRFQDQHGNWTKVGLERRRKGNRIGKGTEFTTYSHRPFKEIRTGQYSSYTDYDRGAYEETFFIGELGHDTAKESYAVKMTAKKDIILPKKKDAIFDILDESIEPDYKLNTKYFGEVKGPEFQAALDKVKRSGYLNILDSDIDLRRKLLYRNPDDPWQNRDSLWNSCMKCAELVHDRIYSDRQGFIDKYRNKGYDAIFDPEDLLYCYDAPVIILNPDAFELGESVPIKNPDTK